MTVYASNMKIENRLNLEFYRAFKNFTTSWLLKNIIAIFAGGVWVNIVFQISMICVIL